MTCKECIHCDICKYRYRPLPLSDSTYDESDHIERIGCPFISKYLFAKLPCKIGDVVYVISDGLISELKVADIDADIDIVNCTICTECFYYHDCDEEDPCVCEGEVCKGYHTDYEFGRHLFFTKEEAEKALERMNKNENL